MNVELSPSDEELFKVLLLSAEDLNHARQCAEYILKKKWHGISALKRGSVRVQQYAFQTAFVVSYARPFAQSRGHATLPGSFRHVYTREENLLHEQLMTLRKKSYAHSDTDVRSVLPWRYRDFATAITDIKVQPITSADAETAVAMIRKIEAVVHRRMEEIHPIGIPGN